MFLALVIFAITMKIRMNKYARIVAHLHLTNEKTAINTFPGKENRLAAKNSPVKDMVFVMEVVTANVWNHSLQMIARSVIAPINAVGMAGVALNFLLVVVCATFHTLEKIAGTWHV